MMDLGELRGLGVLQSRLSLQFVARAQATKSKEDFSKSFVNHAACWLKA